jgi:hypothetical protein
VQRAEGATVCSTITAGVSLCVCVCVCSVSVPECGDTHLYILVSVPHIRHTYILCMYTAPRAHTHPPTPPHTHTHRSPALCNRCVSKAMQIWLADAPPPTHTHTHPADSSLPPYTNCTLASLSPLSEWGGGGGTRERETVTAASGGGGGTPCEPSSDSVAASFAASLFATGFRVAARAMDAGARVSPGHFWQVDHLVPVIEGGGTCGLENLRTLCTPCHLQATRALRARLKGVDRGKGGKGRKAAVGAKEQQGVS